MATARTAAVRPRPRVEPAPRISLWRTPRTRALLLVAPVTLVVWAGGLAARVYTDLLWFREVGHTSVMWTTLEWKVLTAAFVGLATTCAVLGSLVLADRVIGPRAAPDRPAAAALWARRRLVAPVLALACGLVTLRLQPDGAWRLLLLWSHRSRFGAADPVFHRDIGFFVFSLPLYRAIAGWLWLTLIMAAAAAAAAYACAGRPRRARAQLLVLGALLFAVLAWRLQLDRYALVLPHRGSVVPGASYTDVHVRLLVLRVRSVLAILGAGLCLYGVVRGARLLPLAVAGGLVLAAGAATSAFPALVERFDVAPQALSRERPYVADAIAATRQAFGLQRVDVRSLSGDGRLTERDVARDRLTLENVPLWDSSVLRPAMNELESIGSYYSFPTANVDRYTIAGRPQVLTVAARQRDLRRLPGNARTWANDHFAYTHGYGVVAVPAGRADRNRYPRFVQRGFAAGHNPLALTEPRTYFGQANPADPPYAVVASGRGEIEAPSTGSRAPGYHYDGAGGIGLSGLLRRAAFAARFGDLELLLTHTVTARSRIIVHRDVRERVRLLAPFLHWDATPQTVVAHGRIQFLLHGYTTSDDYPYSAPVRVGGKPVNYVRSAAVAVVDGFDGAVRLYVADEADPILGAWRAAYPGLFLPKGEMPAQTRAHLRYPRQLFRAQAAAYATYHAGDPTAFWNGGDAWQETVQLAGPVETAGQIHFPATSRRPRTRRWRTRPAYVLARLPGGGGERFMLTTSFTPRGRQNLVAYLAGWMDGRGAYHLSEISLPRDRLTLGPSQATREMLASPAVNRRVALLNRESRDLAKNSVSRTVLGVQRVVPVGSALVYIQPIYVIAGGSGVPRLQLVTAYANGRVGYGRHLATAIRRVLGAGPSEQRQH